MSSRNTRLVLLGAVVVVLAVVAAWRLLRNNDPLPDDPDLARIEQFRRDGDTEALGKEVAADDTRLALRAVAALGTIHTPASVAQIERAMADSRPEVRAAAAVAFSRAAPRDQGGVVAKLCTDPNETVRAAAATALGEMRAYQQIDVLLKAMGDDRPRVRRRACQAVEKIVGLVYGLRPGDARAKYLAVAARIRADWPKMRRRVEEEHNRE